VSHGSRDLRPQVAIAQLSHWVEQRLQPAGTQPGVLSQVWGSERTTHFNRPVSQTLEASRPLIGTAVLECAPQPLHEQIFQFAAEAIAQGKQQLCIVPLFLLPGVHVSVDLPEQVAIAQQQIGSGLKLTLCPHLGGHPGLSALIAERVGVVSTEAYIVLSHGSRRSGGNQPVIDLAQQLGAVPAYWSVAPSLATQVQTLAALGYHRLAIFPHFMFPGAIGDAIAAQVAELSRQWPQGQLLLLDPLTSSPELAALVVDIIQAAE
jgi:sirohydrochlorin cobaltochelatase